MLIYYIRVYTVLLHSEAEAKWILNYFGINHVMDHYMLLRPKSHLLYGEDTAAVRPLN